MWDSAVFRMKEAFAAGASHPLSVLGGGPEAGTLAHEWTQLAAAARARLVPGGGRGFHLVAVNQCFKFCPAATRSASMFTLVKPRSRKRRRPCQSLASPNRDSTHTARLRI